MDWFEKISGDKSIFSSGRIIYNIEERSLPNDYSNTIKARSYFFIILLAILCADYFLKNIGQSNGNLFYEIVNFY